MDANPLATGWGGVWELQLQLDKGQAPAAGGGKAWAKGPRELERRTWRHPHSLPTR